MKTRNIIAIGILGAGLATATAGAQPAAPSGPGHGRGPMWGQRFAGPGALPPDVREKLKSAATKAKDDPAVKAARDKLRGGDRRAACEELRKAFREAIIKADPSLEEPIKKMGPMARHEFRGRAMRGKGPRHMLGQGWQRGPAPQARGPRWSGDQGFQHRRGWGPMPQQANPGFRGGPQFQSPRRDWGQAQQGPNPQWGRGPGAPNCPQGYCPPQPQRGGRGNAWQNQTPQAPATPRGWQRQVPQPPPSVQGWQQRGPQGRGHGWGPPPHRGAPPWGAPAFQ